MEYLVVSLFAKLEDINSDNVRLKKLQETLSLFKCEKNRDEQNFIRNKAIDFELHNKARTYLIISNECIIAYFTIAFKSIDLVEMSKTEKKKITGGNKLVSHYSAFLIGHLAKDDGVHERMMSIILKEALAVIYNAQRYVGGRLVYLDCKDEPKLIKMYGDEGFKYFKTSSNESLKKFYKKL